MRFKDGLDPVLGSPTKLRLLRALVASPHRVWTGRELAANARVSTAQTARDLIDLLDVGVVSREIRGKSHAWHLCEEHVLTPELLRLFQFEAHLTDMLAKDVAKLLAHLPLRRALLFGSVARGEERDGSDVDLFVEVRSARDKPGMASALGQIRDRLWERFGNPLTALVYTATDARNPPNPPLLKSIERDGIDVRAVAGGGNGQD